VATYRAASGESNQLDVGTNRGFVWRFEDSAWLVASRGCTNVDPLIATCTGPRSARIHLGDQQDRTDLLIHYDAEVWAGAGDDEVVANSVNETTKVHGDGGDDVIEADGRGDQLADGGPGDDDVHCCGIEGGTALGGAGDDVLRYATSLGGPAELDGGAGDDSVVAQPTGAPATATGGAGDDVIVIDGLSPLGQHAYGYTVGGGDGDDTLVGGSFNDAIDGGAGRDYVDVRGGGTDAVTCGDGNDIVRYDSADTISGDCETQLAG
jgi:Ca2+-binding RTX toxin-like protein